MFNFLKEILICPECYEELIWEITDATKIHIMEAKIKCGNCAKIYAAKNGVGCFVDYQDSSDDSWERAENWLKNFTAENPDIIKKLMTADIEKLNAADIMIRSMLNKIEENHEEAERLNKLCNQKAYKEETLKAGYAQADYIINALKNEKDFILDVASGQGTLISKFLENTDVCVVSSDISFNVLKKAKESAEKDGFGDRVSYIAFDLKKSPFKNKSVKTITTYVGLQNIENPEKIFGELRRICGGKLYSACVFCCEDNIVNRKDLENDGLDKTWIKNKYIEEFNNAGFVSVVENSIITLDDPTPVGKIMQGVKIDGFPVEPGNFERAVVISR